MCKPYYYTFLFHTMLLFQPSQLSKKQKHAKLNAYPAVFKAVESQTMAKFLYCTDWNNQELGTGHISLLQKKPTFYNTIKI